MTERWIDLKGFNCDYQISSYGNIRNINYRKNNNMRYLMPYKNKKGYLMVVLQKDNKNKKNNNKTVQLHRVIAENFIDNKENKPQVNHKDGNKLNNRIDNLEWVTSAENIKHAFKNKLSNQKGEKNAGSKLSEWDVKFIKLWLFLGFGVVEISKKFNISQPCISLIKSKKTWEDVSIAKYVHNT